MLVLKILGVIFIVVLLGFIVFKFNNYTYQKTRHKFFTSESAFIVTISYGLIFWGINVYNDAVIYNGDILNGILMIILGFLGLIGLMIYHIKKTSYSFGVLASLFSFIIYIPVSVGLILLTLLMMAFYSNTKPVYRVN